MPIPTGISGSRAAAIIGLSQYSTPFTVWQEIMEKREPGFNAKRGYEFEPFQGNAATEFGHAFESAVIDLTEQETSHTITDREKVYSLDEQDYITCHIDGIINGQLYEGKTVNHRAFGFSWGEPGTDRIPVSYQVQIQHNLMLTGLAEATMGVLVFPKTVNEWEEMGWKAVYKLGEYWLDKYENDEPVRIENPADWARTLNDMGFFHTYNIEAKPDTQKILKELYAEFWGRYIIGDEVPDAVDYEDIRRQFQAPKGVLVVKEDQAEWMREYKAIGREIGAAGHLKKRQKFLKNQILKFALAETAVEDEDAVERMVFMDEQGKKLGSFAKSGFRAS